MSSVLVWRSILSAIYLIWILSSAAGGAAWCALADEGDELARCALVGTCIGAVLTAVATAGTPSDVVVTCMVFVGASLAVVVGMGGWLRWQLVHG